MKKIDIVLSLICIMFLFQSCDLEPVRDYKLHFENTTDLVITLSCNNSQFESFVINPGEKKTAKSTVEWIYTLNLSYPATDNTVVYRNITNNNIVIYQYKNKFEYRITGTAESVFVTLDDANGNTAEYSDVMLPAVYEFKRMNTNYLYISAQNEGKTGSVTVEIWYEGKKIETVTSVGAYVKATASRRFED